MAACTSHASCPSLGGQLAGVGFRHSGRGYHCMKRQETLKVVGLLMAIAGFSLPVSAQLQDGSLHGVITLAMPR